MAWENFQVALLILERKIQTVTKDNVEYPVVMKRMSQLQLRIGDFELIRENFQLALESYEKCKEIRIEIEPPLSRDLAEVYYLIGQTQLYMDHPSRDDDALLAFKNARSILEGILKAQTKMLPEKEDLYTHDGLSIDRTNIKILTEDNDQIKEIKSILDIIYGKIEDTHLQKIQSKIIEKELNLLRENPQQTFFEENNKIQQNIINLGTFGSGRQDIQQTSNFQQAENKIQKTQLNDISNQDISTQNNQEEDINEQKKIKKY